MFKEHSVFISIMLFFIVLTIAITLVGPTVSGYSVKASCEPLSCAERGLEPSGRFYCDNSFCYRDCLQDGVLIEMATFCAK